MIRVERNCAGKSRRDGVLVYNLNCFQHFVFMRHEHCHGDYCKRSSIADARGFFAEGMRVRGMQVISFDLTGTEQALMRARVWLQTCVWILTRRVCTF